MKFVRPITILLSVLTVLSIYQDNALAQPTDRIAESSVAGSDNAAALIALESLPLTGDLAPDPEPPKDPEPAPRPEPPYPPDYPDEPQAP